MGLEIMLQEHFNLNIPELSREEIFLLSAENKMKNYNSTKGSAEDYDCPKCQNRRSTMEIREGNSVFVACECSDIITLIRQRKKLGITQGQERYTFERFRAKDPWQKQLLALAKEFAQSKGEEWLFLGGQCGSGKTHLATAAFFALTDEGKSGRFLSWSDTLNAYREGPAGESWKEILEAVKQVDVLLFDDIFRPVMDRGEIAPPDKMEQRMFQQIMDYRYNNRGITILTSERHLGEIQEFNRSMGGRIRERCQKFMLNIKNDPLRDYRSYSEQATE